MNGWHFFSKLASPKPRLPGKYFMKALSLKRYAPVFITLLFFYSAGFSQPLTFLKMYNKGNIGYTVREVNANSFVVAGGTDFYFNWHWHIMSAVPTTNIHFFKTDNFGNLIWEKIFSRNNSRIIATWFEHTLDDGFIITGHGNRDFVWPPDSNDILLIKTDPNGVITWSKTFDTGKDELGYCVRQTSDGGYIVSGFHDAAPVSIIGNTYALLIKTDMNGNVQWEKKYQFAVRDLANSAPFSFVVRQTADGGYVIVGTTMGSHPADVYVIRVNAIGNLLWAKSYEHDNSVMRFSVGLDIIESASGDFVIAGAMDKDQPAMKTNYPYILKISSGGSLISAKFFETNPLLSFQTGFSSVEQTPDGGFFFTGTGGYASFGDQAHLLKTDVNFNVQWSRVYTWDGIATMGSRSGRITADGGFIFTGKRQMAGTVLMKTDEVGLIPCKNPNVLVEFIPNIIVQNWNPNALSGINTINILLSTQSPLVDTTTVCPVNFTLPVELNYFSAAAVPGKQVQVDWVTASEINNDYFVIEKSTDANHFETAGVVKGAGNSVNFLNYSFIDEHPLNENISYYRLKQVDYNGAFEFSRIAAVSFSGEDFKLISAFADYDNQSIQIYLKSNSVENIEFRLTDMPGKTISHGSKTSAKGVTWVSIDGKNLSRGVYYFTLSNGKKTLIGKIIY